MHQLRFKYLFVVLFFAVLVISCRSGKQSTVRTGTSSTPTTVEQVEVARVWPGHQVGFALLTSPPHQYVAYYDQDRNMTIAHRHLHQDTWTYKVLPERIGWDSHNYIAMTLDKNGHLHVSGNMHGSKLKYFYATEPHNIQSLTRVEAMTGKEESSVTYPHFFKGQTGELLFAYRDGSSGSGNQVYNIYDAEQKSWKRLLDTPFVNGEGIMNAYLRGPEVGPDGYFHIIWVWRDTPDAATNHDLSYARSKDLVHWERSDDTPLKLPITLANAEIIDPVPVKGGMLNGNNAISFDAQKRPVITYHKYDPQGNIQIYNARREANGWKIYQATDWTHRWEFGGNGSLSAEVGVRPVKVQKDGTLTMAYYSKEAGNGMVVLDPVNLKPLRKLPIPATVPPALNTPESDFPGMLVNLAEGAGTSPDKNTRYVLRWETLGRNRDQPREGKLPEPGMLRVYKITK